MGFITFGEIMLRLTPAQHAGKISTSSIFGVNYAGSESNVASSLGVLGNNVAYVTKLPKNSLGDAAIASLRSFGINTDYIARGGQRIGTYFIEIGSSIRPSSVVYDRAGSSISAITHDEFAWEEILKDRKWLFLSGITPVLSQQCAKETIKAAKIARKLGVKVAFDMNYRRSLWKTAADARIIFDQILEHTDLLFGNVGVLKDVYQIDAVGADEKEKTKDAIYKAADVFGVKSLAFTVRNHISASNNEVSGMLLSNGKLAVSKAYEINITDRFGTGDAFAAGCLHSMHKGWANEKTIEFATAAFALKHTLQGDQHTSNEQEIVSIMDGNIGGHVIR